MDSFFDFFNNHGWEGLLILTLCAGLFLMVKYVSKKLSSDVSEGIGTISKQISDQNAKLIDVLIKNQRDMMDKILDKKENETKEHSNLVDGRIIFSKEINDALKDILNIHNAHRVCIFEFHNSQANLSGTPFAKYSCMYEYVAKGIAPIMNKCQGLPVSQLAHIITQVLAQPDEILIYSNMEKMEEDNPILASLLTETKTNTIAYAPLFDKDNILIGLLALEYWIPLEEANLQENQLRLQAAEITSIINLRYKHREKGA